MGTEPGLQTILTIALMAGVEGAESFTFFLGVWTQAWSWLMALFDRAPPATSSIDFVAGQCTGADHDRVRQRKASAAAPVQPSSPSPERAGITIVASTNASCWVVSRVSSKARARCSLGLWQ